MLLYVGGVHPVNVTRYVTVSVTGMYSRVSSRPVLLHKKGSGCIVGYELAIYNGVAIFEIFDSTYVKQRLFGPFYFFMLDMFGVCVSKKY